MYVRQKPGALDGEGLGAGLEPPKICWGGVFQSGKNGHISGIQLKWEFTIVQQCCLQIAMYCIIRM